MVPRKRPKLYSLVMRLPNLVATMARPPPASKEHSNHPCTLVSSPATHEKCIVYQHMQQKKRIFFSFFCKTRTPDTFKRPEGAVVALK